MGAAELVESFNKINQKRTPEGNDVMTETGLYSDAKREGPVKTLCSAAERVMLLESDLYTDDTDHCNDPLYRKSFEKLHRAIKQVDHVLQRLGSQCTVAEEDCDTPLNCELNTGTKGLQYSPGGNTQQNNTRLGDMITARDRRKIQLLSSKLQSMKIYTEERLQLLNSFARCYESYQVSYYQLHKWVVKTSKFQEWIHSVECDNESLIIKNLSHQKRIVEEIEERVPHLGHCQRIVSECLRVFKQIELQAASFKPNLKPDEHLPEVELTQPSTFPSSLHQEFTDLRQRFIILVRLTRCFVTHLRDLLRMRRRRCPFTMRNP
ncbi:plectin-like isoform X2 [Heptranchias perlo]|uniref:plectin-like isoform X2 n=1 Tax=Heptranchias perlo TaxID=212740 RepID=UPI00355A60D0